MLAWYYNSNNVNIGLISTWYNSATNGDIMISAINSALSGLSSASARVAVSADNIANQFSRNYKPKTVEQVSLGNSGTKIQVKEVNQATVEINNPADPDADANGIVSMPNVDVANELVNMSIASYDYKANLKSLKVADNMQKYLLDIIS